MSGWRANGRASQAYFGDALRTGQREQRRENIVKAFRAFQHGLQDAVLRRAQIDKISRLALPEITGLLFEPERLRPRPCREIEHVFRAEEHSPGREPLERVCLQSFLEHAEARAASHVASKRTLDPGFHMR